MATQRSGKIGRSPSVTPSFALSPSHHCAIAKQQRDAEIVKKHPLSKNSHTEHALYDCFSKEDAFSQSLRRAVVSLWRNDEKERERTMGLLMGNGQSFLTFAWPFLKALVGAWRGRDNSTTMGADLCSIASWIRLPMAYAMAGWVRPKA